MASGGDFDWIKAYDDLPYTALRASATSILANHLGLNSTTTVNGLLKDWRGLAELLDFDAMTISLYEQQKYPAVEMLKELSTKHSSLTVGQLLGYIKELERRDALNEVKVAVERDARAYWNSNPPSNFNPVQDPNISSGNDVDPYTRITRQDKPDGTQAHYDAFVSCGTTPTAITFVREMIFQLEADDKNRRPLQLFIMERDSLGGTAESSVTAHLIEKRCRRMVVVLCEEFMHSEACDFQLKFAQALSPGARTRRIIPVRIDRKTQNPDILRFVTTCDYTRKDLRDWFWDRLYDSITMDVAQSRPGDPDVPNPAALTRLTVPRTQSWASLKQIPLDFQEYHV